MKELEPFQISRRLIRKIHITRTGWAFILLTIGIGIAGLNTGNNLLYLIFGMLLSMLIINAVLSSSSLHGLEILFSLPQRLYVGSNNPLKVVIRNKKRKFPSYALTLLSHDERQSHFIFKVAPLAEETFIHFQPFDARGKLALPGFKLLTSYPFGLIEKFIPIPLRETRTIYPQLHTIEQVDSSAKYLRGDYLSGERGTGINPYGIREYQYGDDVRHLHWRSFAKVGKWMMKEFELEKKSQITVNLLVSEQPPQNKEAKVLREKAVSDTASLLMHFIEENRQVGLLINDQPIIPEENTGYIDYYLTTLALFDAKKGDRFLPVSPRVYAQTGAIIAINEAGEGKR